MNVVAYSDLLSFWYITPAMRWTLPISILTMVVVFVDMTYGQNQVFPAFDKALQVHLLQPDTQLRYLSVEANARAIIILDQIDELFPLTDRVNIETYYQPEQSDMLLAMAKGILPSTRMHMMAEGPGHTYFRITDGVCILVLDYWQSPDDQRAVKQSQDLICSN